MITNLALLVRGIHGTDDDTKGGCCNEGDGILRAIGHEQTNVITLFQSQVMQAIGNTIDHGEHFTIGESEIVIDDGQAVRVTLRGHT